MGHFDLYSYVMLSLIVLPFFCIGYIAGMLHMRRNYLELLRRARIQTGHAMRYCETRAKQERFLGYAVGWREGSRK